jgi:hypothetical protein
MQAIPLSVLLLVPAKRSGLGAVYFIFREGTGTP